VRGGGSLPDKKRPPAGDPFRKGRASGMNAIPQECKSKTCDVPNGCRGENENCRLAKPKSLDQVNGFNEVIRKTKSIRD
jgi:hypothetical protein